LVGRARLLDTSYARPFTLLTPRYSDKFTHDAFGQAIAPVPFFGMCFGTAHHHTCPAPAVTRAHAAL
jgi:hypothetical protein